MVVTDGNDNASVISLENLVKAAQQSEVLIYAVGLLSEEERARSRRAPSGHLTALAEATGGEAFFPKDVSEVDRIAHQVAHDIRSQYTIEYTPTNTAMDGTFRQIKVAVNAPGNPHGAHPQRLLRHARPGRPHGFRGKRAGFEIMRSFEPLSSYGGLAGGPAGAGKRNCLSRRHAHR